MKKIVYIVVVTIVVTLCMCACAKKESSGIPADELIQEIKQTANFSNPKEESMLDKKVAERYGISTDSIVNGRTYYDDSAENADKIIFVIAKDDSSVQKLEQALHGEKVRLSEAFANNEEQSEKIKNSVLKTRGHYIIFIISENAKEIEKIFDKLV